MSDSVGACLPRDFDQPLGYQRSRDRRPQEILSFVHCVRAEHRKHEIADKLLLEIIDEYFRCVHLLRFRAGRLQFFALSDICGKGDDFAIVFFLQPLQDDGGIEPAGISEYDFLD